MTGVVITSLPTASTLTGAEYVPVVQSGTTVKTPVNSWSYTPAGTGAVTTTVQSKLRETVSVKDFGAVGNGVADDTAAFTAAIAACKANGYTRLSLVGGTYKLTSRLTIDFSDFIIDGEGATIIWAGTGLDSLSTGVFQLKGSLSTTTTTVTTDAAEYTSSIAVASTSGFAVGDIIQIDSASVVSPGLYVNVTARIVSIVGTTIATDVVRRLALTVSENVTVTKVNAIQRSGVENCNFVATGQTSRSNGMGGVFLQFTALSHVKSCTFKGFWFKGVAVQFSLNTLLYEIATFEPAAVGGGEGYGVQFEYTYNSTAEKLIGTNLRHLIDLTCAWHINVIDCQDSVSQSASYSLHSAYEYDVAFIGCFSQGNTGTNIPFTLGSISSGFADYTDQISLIGCSITNCSSSYGVKFNSKGSGLKISGTTIQMTSGVVAVAIAVGNADVLIENSICFGAVQAIYAATANSSGVIQINNCLLNAQSNQRSLQLQNATIVNVANTVCNGLVQIGNSTLYAQGSKFLMQSTDTQYITFDGTTANTSSLYLSSCTFDPTVATSAARSFLGSTNIFNGCVFLSDPSAQPINLYAPKTVLNNCTGYLRAQILSTVTDCTFSDNDLYQDVGGSRIFNAVSFVGKLIVSGNILQMASRTANCFIVNSSNVIPALVFANNVVKGKILLTDAEITNAAITGNVVDGVPTYPTAGAQKTVTGNVAY